MNGKKLLNAENGLDMLGGDKNLYKLLIDTFLEENGSIEKQFADFMAKGKTSEAATLIHKCKGAAGQIGAEKLYESCKFLESVLHGEEKGEPEKLFASLAKTYKETATALNEYKTLL